MQLIVRNKIKISYFLTKKYVKGTQKNCLNEMVLMSTQSMLKLMVRKIFTIELPKPMHLIFATVKVWSLISVSPLKIWIMQIYIILR